MRPTRGVSRSATLILGALLASAVFALPVHAASTHTWLVPSEYQTIDQAITVASPGDTILVSAGNYSGFTVDRAVIVQGAGAQNTFVTGPVIVRTNGSTVSGFSVSLPQGQSLGEPPLTINGNDNLITSNSIQCDGSANNATDIQGSSNLLSYNSISCPSTTRFSPTAIVIQPTTSNDDVENNTIYASDGIYLAGAGTGNLISGNSFMSDGEGIFCGCMYVAGLTISSNLFPEAKGTAIILSYFIPGENYQVIGYHSGDAISSNTIRGGSGIQLADIDGVKVWGNNIQVSGTGIELGNSTTVWANSISQGSLGVDVYGSNDTIYENNFINNTVQAQDDGSNNNWDVGGMGNYWSNWVSPANQDGIVSLPYPIPGSARAVDHYPLANPVDITALISSSTTSSSTVPEFGIASLAVVMAFVLSAAVVVSRRIRTPP